MDRLLYCSCSSNVQCWIMNDLKVYYFFYYYYTTLCHMVIKLHLLYAIEWLLFFIEIIVCYGDKFGILYSTTIEMASHVYHGPLTHWQLNWFVNILFREWNIKAVYYWWLMDSPHWGPVIRSISFARCHQDWMFYFVLKSFYHMMKKLSILYYHN